MKNIILIAVITICVSSASRADSLKHVDAETFMKEAEMIGMITSTDTSAFIGSVWNRVYIEHSTVITVAHILHLKEKPTITVYWTELDTLPKDVIEDIKSGKSPWTRFDHKKRDATKQQHTIDLDDIFSEPKKAQ